MTETSLTTPVLSEGNLPTPAAQPAFLNARTQVALLATFLVLAANTALAGGGGGGGGGVDLGPISQLVCDVAKQLTAAKLLGAAGFIIVVVFGWNKLMGESNAFQGLKNGVIGGLIILSAGTIAQALFKGGC